MDASEDSSPAPTRLRLVIFPWLAFGHLLPYLELTDRLASRGHHVSFVSTPRNVARLPPLRPAAAPHVEMVALPLPRVDGLPDGAECTNDVPADKFGLLRKAFDGLEAPFAEFLGRTRPDWIIVDSFHHWAAAAAIQHKIPCAVLLPSAAILAAYDRPETMPRYEREQLSRFFKAPNESGISTAERCALAAERCTLGVMRSCVEWEPEHFPAVAAAFGKPVVPLGLLPPSPDGGRRTRRGKEEEEEPAVLRWLDAQPPGSVLYVALGSEVPLRAEQVRELAHGLDLAGTRFLWALRNPRLGSGAGDPRLPAGFLERTGGRGVVATGWVPQMSILAHAAVGAFLTHCGRNSLVESLLFGHPLVMLPIFGDQGPNARAMEARKVGLQIKRDDSDGSFHRDGVAQAVRAVMVDHNTRSVFVANARNLQKMVADKELHERYIDDLIRHLGSYSRAPAGVVEPHPSSSVEATAPKTATTTT